MTAAVESPSIEPEAVSTASPTSPVAEVLTKPTAEPVAVEAAHPQPGLRASSQRALVQVLGPEPDLATLRSHTRIQAWLLRSGSPRLTSNPWFTAVLGAVIALLGGLALTAVVRAIWAGAISSAVGQAISGSSTAGSLGSIANSLLVPDILKLYAVAHRVPLVVHVEMAALGTSAAGDMTITIPLTGLLLVPAVALILGGYVAASSDFTRAARFSMARGALMGPFYAMLLGILAMFSTTGIQGQVGEIGGSVTLGVSAWQAVLLGLVWGVLFGALGGWIQFAGRGFLSAGLARLQAIRQVRVAAAIGGAGVALIAGMLIFTVLAVVAVTFLATYVAGPARSTAGVSLPNTVPLAGAAGGMIAVAVVALLLMPTLAIYAFVFAAGAPVTMSLTGTSIPIVGSVPTLTPTSSSISLFGGAPTGIPPNAYPALYLIVLVPLLCYFIGGRVAARIARADTTEAGVIAGALISLPLGVLAAGCAVLVSGGVTISAVTLNTAMGVGPSVMWAFFAVLIGSAVMGGLGGASAVVMRHPAASLMGWLRPLRPLVTWPVRLLDRVTGRPPTEPLSLARKWMYGATIAAAVLGLVVIAIDIVGIALAEAISMSVLRTLLAVAAALLVGIPLLLFLGALVALFAAPLPAEVPGSSGQAVEASPVVSEEVAQPAPVSLPTTPQVTAQPSTGNGRRRELVASGAASGSAERDDRSSTDLDGHAPLAPTA